NNPSSEPCVCVFIRRAAGIALLAVILTALLILGCWYYRRRGGYKMIRVSHVTPGQYRESGSGEENKVALNEFSNLQPAVHTHTHTHTHTHIQHTHTHTHTQV
uniref:Uncharacterized protein n=1 Tax=Cyprinus carpio TaxID=7962 RepID=A0A8C1T2W6_CYPCA